MVGPLLQFVHQVDKDGQLELCQVDKMVDLLLQFVQKVDKDGQL